MDFATRKRPQQNAVVTGGLQFSPHVGDIGAKLEVTGSNLHNDVGVVGAFDDFVFLALCNAVLDS